MHYLSFCVFFLIYSLIHFVRWRRFGNEASGGTRFLFGAPLGSNDFEGDAHDSIVGLCGHEEKKSSSNCTLTGLGAVIRTDTNPGLFPTIWTLPRACSTQRKRAVAVNSAAGIPKARYYFW